LTTAATMTSPVGTYTITADQGTLAAANYTFTFNNGILTVTPAEEPPPGPPPGRPQPIFVTGTDANAPPHVRVYRADGTLVASFYAFPPGFRGGVRVAVGDVNGDGILDIIAGVGLGAGPHIKVIDGTRLNEVLPDGEIADSALLASFMAFAPGFHGGVFVAAG